LLLNKIADDNLTKKILKNSSVIFLGNSAAAVLGLISFVIMANALGAKYLAFFALAQVYVLIVNAIFNIQTWELLIKFVSKKDKATNHVSIIKTNILVDCLSALTAFVAAYFLLAPVSNLLSWEPEISEMAYVYICVIPFTLTTLTIGIPRLYNKFSFIAKVQFGTAIFKLVFIFLLSHIETDAANYILVYLISEIILNLTLIFLSLSILKANLSGEWINSKLELKRDEFKFLWWTNLRTIVRIPVRHLDIVIIHMVISAEVVGIYKVYKEFIEIVNRLSDPVNQALYPEYTKLIGSDNISDTLMVTRKIMIILGMVSIGITAVMTLLASPAIGYFFAEEFSSLISVLYILILLTGLNFFLVPINSLFIAAGFAKYSFYIVLFSNIIYVIILYYGGVTLGIFGIVLAFGFQILLNQGSKIFFLLKFRSDWNHIIR
jgi:O-antigen/teichoic acid export membrane protein